MKKDLIVHESPKSPVSEAVRLLRTNLSFLAPHKKSKVFLITSSMPGEGKSWITANLAISFAQTNKKVLIIDADLRKGRQHTIFGCTNNVGLSNFLNDAAVTDDDEIKDEMLMKAMSATDIPNLFILAAGVVPPNPSELLGSESLDYLISVATESFDIVIFDMPPVSIVADSLVICKKVDFVVLVSASNITKKDVLLNSKKSIEHVGGKIAGVVLNMVPIEKRKEYTKYYSKYAETSLQIEDNNLAHSRKRRG
ncbi:MAG: CpsD/CapB family tyrosine-protein kinase [Clostridia bacterium]